VREDDRGADYWLHVWQGEQLAEWLTEGRVVAMGGEG
jgi:hypothetical protein